MKKNCIILLFILISNIVSFAEIKDSVGVTKVSDKLYILYMVSPGETIYGISTKYGIPVSDLLEINPELESGLKVGQVINIPYSPELRAKAPDENSIVHKVQPGETLYGIAKKYNTSVNELMRLNNMQLKSGQDLIVGYKNQPKSTANTPSTPPSRVEPKEELKGPEPKVTESRETVAKEQPSGKEVKEVAKIPAEEKPVNVAKPYAFDPDRKQILVIPFDPYLYFSDADAEIAAKSNMAMPKVRQMFRRRLNALMDVQGYEMIYLLGGKSKDSTSDLNKIYGSVTYGYQDILYSDYNPKSAEYKNQDNALNQQQEKSGWFERTKNRMQGANQATAINYNTPKDHGKYFGVKIRDPEFFNYFKQKYDIDYYIFINQFEVKTNYENCLDRAALNYERTFTTHYSIFDSNGKQIAGNKFKTNYNSNSNYIYTIVSDNAPKIVDRIMADVPPPNK
ncbi:MAG TPA: LysM peptidoglycan-binding domain-containing protein [Cytophagaceae bacterium]|jgi:LysM repeat protein|nr:LysM peptidoglycan-binding domain-containing protein [Cytophagaceae bacterium]